MEFSPSELWSTEARRDRLGFYARVRDAGSPVPQIEPGTGRRFWVVARYRDVRDGLIHPDIGHGSGGANPGSAWQSDADRVSSRQLISLDPPDHTRLRALVNAAFTARVVDRLAPWITDVVGLLDRLAARDVIDGVSDLAAPVPVSVIAELVGIPEEDRTQFREWSRLIVSGGASSRVATAEFADYIDGIAAHRRITPEDDLLSGLVALENDGASLDRDELVAMIHLLLIAGQETTVDLISNGVLAMLTNPDQWHALTAEPSLASAVVEEVLRYDGPVEIVPPRIALRELEFAGGIIPAFETVALSVYGANHDPDVFAEPASFDIHRPDVAQHLAFGHGAHFCLGARLARLEGRIMFEQLALRFPKLQLAGDPADRRGDEPRVTSLPLRLE